MNTYVTDYSALFNRANEAVTAALGPAPDGVEIPAVLRTSDTLAGRIDHTLLKADATLSAVRQPPSNWPAPASWCAPSSDFRSAP